VYLKQYNDDAVTSSTVVNVLYLTTAPLCDITRITIIAVIHILMHKKPPESLDKIIHYK